MDEQTPLTQPDIAWCPPQYTPVPTYDGNPANEVIFGTSAPPPPPPAAPFSSTDTFNTPLYQQQSPASESYQAFPGAGENDPQQKVDEAKKQRPQVFMVVFCFLGVFFPPLFFIAFLLCVKVNFSDKAFNTVFVLFMVLVFVCALGVIISTLVIVLF